MKLFRPATLAALCAAIALLSSCALFRQEGRTKVDTLLVTGNYLDARLITELAQYHTKQPVVIFSTDIDETLQMYFIPTSQKEAEPAPTEQFSELITHLNPKRVVFVGGSLIVPQNFVDEAKKISTTLVLDSDNWSENAKELGHLLRQRRLQREYDDYRKRLNERGLTGH